MPCWVWCLLICSEFLMVSLHRISRLDLLAQTLHSQICWSQGWNLTMVPSDSSFHLTLPVAAIFGWIASATLQFFSTLVKATYMATRFPPKNLILASVEVMVHP